MIAPFPPALTDREIEDLLRQGAGVSDVAQHAVELECLQGAIDPQDSSAVEMAYGDWLGIIGRVFRRFAL